MPTGAPSDAVLRAAWLNASLQTGLASPLDEAICARGGAPRGALRARAQARRDPLRLRAQAPRRRGARAERARCSISKGAFASVLEVCEHVRAAGGVAALDAERRARLEERFAALERAGRARARAGHALARVRDRATRGATRRR